MNNYLEYFCGIYEICFKSQTQLNKEKTAAALTQSKFYDPTAENFFGTTTLNIYSNSPIVRPLSARNKSVKFHSSEWDVVPKSCNGDWVMRYSENETNFNPWQFNTKFSHFELVPWRQQKKQIDLTNAVGWEPFQLTSDCRDQLKKLQKFELKRSKRLLKRRIQLEKNRIKRHIKIRFIFSFEFRNRKMKFFNSQKSGQQSHRLTYRDRRIFIFDKSGFDLNQHWGYFSQRNKGIEELLVNDGSQLRALNNVHQRSSAQQWPNNALPAIESAKETSCFKEVPCDECKDRCV